MHAKAYNAYAAVKAVMQNCRLLDFCKHSVLFSHIVVVGQAQ